MTDFLEDQKKSGTEPSLSTKGDRSPQLSDPKPTDIQILSVSSDIVRRVGELERNPGEWFTISDSEELIGLNDYIRSIPGVEPDYQLQELRILPMEDYVSLVGFEMNEKHDLEINLGIKQGNQAGIWEQGENKHKFKELELFRIAKLTQDILQSHQRHTDQEQAEQLINEFTVLVDGNENSLSDPATNRIVNIITSMDGPERNLDRLKRMERVLKSRELMRPEDSLQRITYTHHLSGPGNNSQNIGEIKFELRLTGVEMPLTPRISLLMSLNNEIQLASNYGRFDKSSGRSSEFQKLRAKVAALSDSTVSKTRLSLLQEANRVLGGQVQ